MNTRLIMSSTAILLAAIGISLTFAPDIIITSSGLTDSAPLRLVLQLLGAMYAGFAMLNWMAKGAIIGGIYNRPIVTANLGHFLIGGIALTKAVFSSHQFPVFLTVIAGFYMVTACFFGLLFSRHPDTKTA